jgi:hypothetical protein
MEGQTVSHYRILEKIGGMPLAYAAKQVSPTESTLSSWSYR